MADFAFNISLGKIGYYASLPAANDALVFIPFESTGLATDAVLKDLDTLAAVKSNATEQTTMGRKTVASSTVTVDDTNDRTDFDVADVTWTAPGGNPTGKLVVCYDPDTTVGTDADLILLSAHDFVSTPNGSDDIRVQIAAAGLYRVQ